MRPPFFALFLVCLVLAANLMPAHAQVTALISGRVEDTTGAVLSGATVTVRNNETGLTRTVTTDDAGNFRALFLSVGGQEVKAEVPGFKTAVRSGINLDVGQ